MNIRLWTALLLLLFIATTNFAAPKTQLKKINKNIQSLRIDLKKSTIKKSHLQIALGKTEIKSSHIHKQIHTTKKKLSLRQKKLRHLKSQSKPLFEKKNAWENQLKEQLRNAFLLSQQPYLKLLLDPNHAQQTQRTLIYFRYIAQTQIKTIAQLQISLSAYKINQQAIQREYATLLTLKQTQLQHQQALYKSQAKRRRLIQSISQHIKTKHQKLAHLIADKTRLKRTLAALNKKEMEKYNAKQGLARFRGKLPWPVQGRVRRYFGTKINQSELRWKGTLIEAPPGRSVHAIAAGQVIFAKWLSGYGLLMIINHGNSYMTLYGRNQALTKKVGDRVRAGEVIATVGNTGGFAHAALYFSIRHNAQALNPAIWCHGRA